MLHNLQVRRLHNLHDMISDNLSFKNPFFAYQRSKRIKEADLWVSLFLTRK